MYKIPNYGYVPFEGFQQVILIVITILIILYSQVNEWIDKVLDSYFERRDEKEVMTPKNITKFVILSIPILLYFYYDTVYSSFSFFNLGITNMETQRIINYVLLVFGSYGIIQVLSQDFGLKTGLVQRDMWHFVQPLTFLMYVGTAYALSANRSQSVLAGFIYYHLKYVISNNTTSTVCFEDV